MNSGVQTRPAYIVVFGVLFGVAAGALSLVLLPSVISTTLGSTDHIYWYISRSSGIAAYFLLWSSVFMGLMITSRTATIWPGGPAAISVHQFASLFGLALVAIHALILIGDAFISYSFADVLIPFAGTQYEHFWVGIGQTAFYIGLFTALSWYARFRIGYSLWRRMHYLTFGMFTMALAHGVLVGTDTENAAVTMLYIVTGGAIAFMLFYRILAVTSVRSPLASGAVLNGAGDSAGDAAQVTFLPEGTVANVPSGSLLLDVAESSGVSIPVGCRAGTCGLDPVFVVSGADGLTPVRGDEKATLSRLGLSEGWRLACSAGVCGNVSVSQEEMSVDGDQPIAVGPDFNVDESVKKVVIIGNGVAGTTAADQLRKYLPECEITIISREPRHFYNRMAIAKLIEEDGSPEELILSSEDWYQQRNIECLLGAEAVRIDTSEKVVVTDRGRYLEYDRVLLAGGSESAVPPIEGWGLAGCFTLRDIDDAMAIRDFVKHYSAKEALVLGGGLLGLEAAYSLRKRGLRTTVIDRNKWIMHRQVDAECGEILHKILDDLDIQYLTGSNIGAVSGTDRLLEAELENGQTLTTDLLLASTGIKPSIGLATEAGLEVERGILIDDHMRSSDPTIFAAGDIAQHRGAVYGLWGASAEQAKIAAMNIAGADKTFTTGINTAQLKVFGVDFVSFGDINGSNEDTIIRHANIEDRKYRKLVIRDGQIVGAIFLGEPELASEIVELARSGEDVSSRLSELQRGEWQQLVA